MRAGRRSAGWRRESRRSSGHTKYPGGIRLISLQDKMEKDPTFAVTNAVKGMIPHNKLGRRLLKKLKVYAGAKHPHESQQPKELTL